MKLVRDGAVMSSGLEVTVTLPDTTGVEKFPTRSVRNTAGVQVPASEKRGIVTLHAKVPLLRVPVDGVFVAQPWT
jgi:hypothetical protein